MTGDTKRKTLILLGLIALITMILAASLPQLELQPGMPPPRFQDGQVVAAPIKDAPFVSTSILTFFIVLIGIIVVAAMLSALIQLLRGAHWKTVLDSLRSVLIISGMVIGFIFLLTLFPHTSSNIPVEMPVPTPKPVVTAPLGEVPPLLLWLVGIGLLVISVLVGLWIFTSSRQANPIELVGLEAEKAWQALKTGSDLKDVVIQCYLQMSRALKKERGIERKDFMTTGEFEHLLEAAGIPHEPIYQLTRLFDAVRYGNWQPNSADEQKAIQCLEAIVLYSRENKGTN